MRGMSDNFYPKYRFVVGENPNEDFKVLKQSESGGEWNDVTSDFPIVSLSFKVDAHASPTTVVLEMYADRVDVETEYFDDVETEYFEVVERERP